ncbi:hypothetical protein [Agarivorans gilvus]|uniref:hypothetical protein n=1 Tax=Agarivorans gilvus TaxID=680279 RepID=UPI0006EC3091|nr:hypothetical protein [Agarivorans gilvus]
MNLQTITAAQRKQLETKCANRLNWTDGGHWIGRGKAPNCFVRQKSTSTKSHTYKFPTDESATRWNMEWEKTIRQAGHFGTALLTVGVTVATSGFGGMAIGTLAAIAKDELQAQIPYPRMARGWTYELIFTHEFSYSPTRIWREYLLKP